jgi:hypothetical protein
VLDFERQSVPRSRDVDKNGSHPDGLRAIGHLPTFGGKLSTFGCVNHPRPRSDVNPYMQNISIVCLHPTYRSVFDTNWRRLSTSMRRDVSHEVTIHEASAIILAYSGAISNHSRKRI